MRPVAGAPVGGLESTSKTGEFMSDTKDGSTVRVGHHLLVGAMAAAAAIGATSAVATTDIFLTVGDIIGESSDEKHPNEIEALAWSWGVNGAITGGQQKGGSQPACAQPLSVDKFVDRATPPLMMSAGLGTAYPRATLTLRKAGAAPIEFVVVTLTEVTVKSLTNGGSTIDDRMKESLTLGFRSATITYRQQQPDGRPGPEVSAITPGSCP
jgi:type VI secretion system secreted protein Hcp